MGFYRAITKRSRNGCLNCKKLKIKCNEQKPSCKHCLSTSKECIYQHITIEQKTIDLRLLDIFSISKLLRLNSYQLRLLKNHSDFGYTLLAKGDSYAVNVWTQDLLCQISNGLVRESLYCLSSLTLWSKYDLNKIHMVHYRDDKVTRYLVDQTEHFFENLVSKLNLVDCNNTPENDVSFVIGCMSVIAYITLHPTPPLPLVCFDSGENDLLSLFSRFHRLLIRKKSVLISSGLEFLPERYHICMIKTSKVIPLVSYLKDYITMYAQQKNISTDLYLEVVENWESFLQNCISSTSFEQYYAGLPQSIVRNEAFTDILREKDYLAMKIIYFSCAVCQMFSVYINSQSSIWLLYMEQYMEMCGERDPFDTWLFDKVVKDRFKITPSNMHYMSEFGKFPL